MLDFLKEFSKDGYDAIFVLPGDTKDDLHIEDATYKEPGEKVGGNAIGDEYHVILFKEQEDGELYNVDKFEAIFADPCEYISNLIPQNWFGIFAKRTTTSDAFIQKTFDKLMKA
jgi:hypothetical protein